MWQIGLAAAAGLLLLFLIVRKFSPGKANFEKDVLGGDGGAAAEQPRIGMGKSGAVLAAMAVAPKALVANAQFRIWVGIDKKNKIERLGKKRASELGGAPSRAVALSEKVKRGAILDVTVTGPGLPAAAIQRLRWAGKALEASFLMRLPSDIANAAAYYDVSIHLDGLCLGVIPLTFSVGAQEGGQQTVDMRRPERVFISYSRPDRRLALEIGRAYNRIGVKTFVDRLSLEGGDHWEERLGQEIDRCDTLFLLWSEASAASKWVHWEVARALSKQSSNPDRRPGIITHIVGAPPPAKPPEALSSLQFNDPALALWEQSILEAREKEKS